MKLALSFVTFALISTAGVGRAQQVTWVQSPLNGHWYGAVGQNMSWSQGEALAIARGGHLATIRSSTEQSWISTTFQPQLPVEGFWIGLTDIAVEGSWAWASGEPLVFTNWAVGMPDSISPAEDFVHLIGTAQPPAIQWTWNGNSDSAGSIRPLIETPRSPDLTTLQFCAGDGLDSLLPSPCPCSNVGTAGRGCANSVNGSGALLVAAGTTTPDTMAMTCSGMPASAACIFVQGTASVSLAFGDGLRCVGGVNLRMYVRFANAGTAYAPDASEPSITLRAGALGDAISPGTARLYQVFYRDSDFGFCPHPQGSTWNTSNAVQVTWL